MTESDLTVYHLLKNKWDVKDLPVIIGEYTDYGIKTNKEGNQDKCNYIDVSKDVPEWEWNINKDKAMNQIVENGKGSIQLWYDDVDFIFNINTDSNFEMDRKSPVITLSFDFSLLWGEGERKRARKNVETILEISKILHIFGCEYTIGDINMGELVEDQIFLEIPHKIFWLNIFSSKIVRKLGKPKILSSPAWKVDELKDDSVLLVTNENPLYWKKNNNAYERIEEHLGIR